MRGVLFRYLSKLLLQRTLATLLALVGLLIIVDLFEAASDVLERGLGFGGVIKYEVLRLPAMVQQIVPVSVLIGALTCFTGLARNSEMAALRATGVTIYRIVLLLAPACALIGVIYFLVADQVTPRSQHAFNLWWNATAPKAQPDAERAPADKSVWFRSGAYVVHAQSATPDGRRMEGVRIYRRDQRGRLAERLEAARADYVAEGQWRLTRAAALEIAPTTLSSAPARDQAWATDLKPQDVVSVFWPDDRISTAQAIRAMRGDRPADKSPGFYQTRVQRALAEPLGILVMMLLAAPAALAQQRNNQATLMMFSLGAGLLFLMVDGVLTALGQTSVLPPLLAAWGGPVLFAALAGAAMVHLEG